MIAPSPTTVEPTIEIVNVDVPLSDRAIDALAELLIAAGDNEPTEGATT